MGITLCDATGEMQVVRGEVTRRTPNMTTAMNKRFVQIPRRERDMTGAKFSA